MRLVKSCMRGAMSAEIAIAVRGDTIINLSVAIVAKVEDVLRARDVVPPERLCR